MQIAKNLNYLMSKWGMTNRHLAKQLGVTDPTIGKYKEEVVTPPIDKLIKICELFEVDLTAFVLEDLSESDGPDVVREPGVSYQRRLEAENKELQARVNQLELALHRHIKDRDILRRYVKDA
jgi:transcriptional regulator with XRE-family HTH domain